MTQAIPLGTPNPNIVSWEVSAVEGLTVCGWAVRCLVDRTFPGVRTEIQSHLPQRVGPWSQLSPYLRDLGLILESGERCDPLSLGSRPWCCLVRLQLAVAAAAAAEAGAPPAV